MRMSTVLPSRLTRTVLPSRRPRTVLAASTALPLMDSITSPALRPERPAAPFGMVEPTFNLDPSNVAPAPERLRASLTGTSERMISFGMRAAETIDPPVGRDLTTGFLTVATVELSVRETEGADGMTG